MNKLRALSFFVSTVEEGSFASAAKQYGTDPSTVSKAIQRLETELGIALLRRSTRQLNVTEAGRQYAITARRILEELGSCEADLRHQNDEVSGRLKLSLPYSYGRLYIRPMLLDFCRSYPNIELELHFDDTYTDIIEGGYDVSIRSGRVSDSQLILRQLSPMDFVICASQSYIDKFGLPENPAAFSQHAWIRFRYAETGRLAEVNDNKGLALSVGEQFVVNDGESMSSLCAAGLGLSQMPHFVARDGLFDKRFLPIFPSYRIPGAGVYLLYAKREYLPAKVRAFVDFVTTRLSAEGETPRSTWTEKLMPLMTWTSK